MVDAGQQFTLDLELVQRHRIRHLLVLQHLHHHGLVAPDGEEHVRVGPGSHVLQAAQVGDAQVARDGRGHDQFVNRIAELAPGRRTHPTPHAVLDLVRRHLMGLRVDQRPPARHQHRPIVDVVRMHARGVFEGLQLGLDRLIVDIRLRLRRIGRLVELPVMARPFVQCRQRLRLQLLHEADRPRPVGPFPQPASLRGRRPRPHTGPGTRQTALSPRVPDHPSVPSVGVDKRAIQRVRLVFLGRGDGRA